ncbi:MAG: cyclase family protein [Gemmatimonadaceae bacterium]
MSHRIYDVSAPVRHGGLIYPGNPGIVIEAEQAISAGAGANVSRISFGSHTGTHVDAAHHFIDGAQTVDEIPLERLVGPAILIDVGDSLASVGAEELAQHDIGSHTRVLIRTRNSGMPDGPEFVRDYTFLAPDGAQYLADRGVVLVGIDYLSIEKFRSGHHMTHKILLGRNIVIVEGLALTGPPAGAYDFFCLPLRLEGLDGSPARAILIDKKQGDS